MTSSPKSTIARIAMLASFSALLVTGCSEAPEALVKSAREYIAKGDPSAAAIQLRNALQKAPDNAEARYLLGTLLKDRRDAAGAVKELRRALELGYPADQVVPALARAMVDDGDAKELVDEFGARKLTNPDAQADLKTIIGNALVDLGKPKEAEAAFNAALSAKPEFADASLGIATLRAREHNLGEATKIVDAVLARPNPPPEASLLKAELLSSDGQQDAARAVLEKLTETSPRFLPARYQLAATLIAGGELDKATAQIEAIRKVSKLDTRAYYLEALIAAARGDLPAARDAVQLVLKSSPRYGPALVLAGEIEYRSRSYNQAENYLRQALSIMPGLAYAERLLAATYLRLGSPAHALEVLQPQLSRGSRDPQLMAIAGEAYLAAGDLAKADQYFAQVASLDPKNAAARTRLGQVRFAEGDTDAAVRDLEAASALDPNVSSADLALIANLVRRRQFDDALAAVGKLEQKQPSNPLVYNLKGLVYVAKHDLAKARASFERALQVQSDYLPAVTSLAQLDRAEQHPDAARKRFEAILEKEPKNEQALLGYAGLVQSLGGDPAEVETLIKKAIAANPQSIGARVALVNFYVGRGDLKQAQLAAQDANAAIPNDPRTLEVLGQVQLAAGDSTLAIGTFTKLVALRPGTVDPLMRLARALIVAKDYDRAIDKLRDALLLNPDLFEANREIVAIYALTGRPELAAKEIKAFQQRKPDDPRGYVLEGDMFATQRKYPEAEAAYKNAQKRGPDDPTIAAKLHAAAAAQGKTAAADAASDKWLHDHPKDVALRNYLGERALSKKDYKSAARYYQALVAQQPENPAFLNNLAWVAGEMNDPKALSYAEKAVSLAPDNAAALDTLGSLLVKKGDLSQGVEKIRRAAQLAPAQGDIRLHLAKSLIQAGDKDGARKELDALVQAGSQESPAKDAKQARPPPGSKPPLICNPACATEAAGLLKTL
ncbi:MAG TPA: XrtA/PEP-CTERM system TPR-repeat protein PrsT [Casimicrobiaceae bacterium]|nr:XrtA/PEP-CTERM system TPR-repeat protein PrsT [Casimicrobiaceae bacterium]